MSSSTVQWQRLSPISIIFFLGRILKHIIKDALPAMAPIAVILFNSDNKEWISLLIIVGMSLFLLTNAFLQYLFFRFQVQQDKIIIHEGVFNKKQRLISYDKIQNINLLQPFYFKPFKLSTLQLETAGSKSNEANLAGITITHAEEIKASVLSVRQNITDSLLNEDSELTEKFEPELLNSADTKALVKYGVTNNGMWWFFVFMAPFFSQIEKIGEQWIGQQNIDWAIDATGGIFVLIPLIITTILFLMITFSILGSIFRYHNYRLTYLDKTLKRFGGLLTTHEESAKLSKIQAFVNKTNFVGRWLKVENVFLKQASGIQNNANSNNKLFVVPSLTQNQTNALLNRVFSLTRLPTDLAKVSPRYILKTWAILMLIPSSFCIIIAIATQAYWVLLFCLIGLPMWYLVHLRWKNFGYAIDSQFATIRKGMIGYRQITFPLFKVQRASISQSPMQKRNNLATLKIFLASDRLTLPYITLEEAEKWFDKISYQIETSEKNWF